MEQDGNLRLRIWQKNGDAAWTSPVFVSVRGERREERQQ